MDVRVAGGPGTVQQGGEQAVPVGGQVGAILAINVLDGGQLGILLHSPKVTNSVSIILLVQPVL